MWKKRVGTMLRDLNINIWYEYIYSSIQAELSQERFLLISLSNLQEQFFRIHGMKLDSYLLLTRSPSSFAETKPRIMTEPLLCRWLQMLLCNLAYLSHFSQCPFLKNDFLTDTLTLRLFLIRLQQTVDESTKGPSASLRSSVS